ncbi:MAG TPA: NADH-quinone oxidoreductase subunit J [Thermoguttaceae bacterium]|nr:NADH-quinone oxidoreductase subunit J [Thermoguttaceae bacterium]
MNHSAAILLIASLAGAAALALLAPTGWKLIPARLRLAAGVVFGAASLGLFVSRLPVVGDWLAAVAFYPLAAVTLVAAVATVTSRKPVYSAVWFGLVLLCTAGLFLISGAQFLAVATVVVYAGAILVTFLFVLMLALPEGRAGYDQRSRESLVSATVAAVMIGVLAVSVGRGLDRAPEAGPAGATAEARADGVLGAEHVARFGGDLFGRHLLAVEVAGALLLAALVGAAAIAGRPRTLITNEVEPQMDTDKHR